MVCRLQNQLDTCILAHVNGLCAHTRGARGAYFSGKSLQAVHNTCMDVPLSDIGQIIVRHANQSRRRAVYGVSYAAIQSGKMTGYRLT